MKQKTKGIGLGLVFAGLVFFFNPVVQLFDILPDALGALLIYFGLKTAALADGYFEDARQISFYLVWIYAVKLAFSFSLTGYPENALPYTFISGVVEMIFLLPFFHKLYAGFEYTSMRQSGGKASHNVNNAYIMSVIFVIAKSVLAFAPEIIEFLRQNEEVDLSANAAYTISVSVLKPYAVVLSVFIQLILGVIFIAQTRKFFKEIKGDIPYISVLREKAENELEVNRKIYTEKAVSKSCICFAVSAVFMADIYIEGIDILPDVFVPLCILFGFLSVKNLYSGGLPKLVTAISVLCGIFYTGFSAYVRPELFELLALEKSMLENHSNGFWEKGVNSALYGVSSIIFALVLIVQVVSFIRYQKNVCSENMLGNHDRKLLTVGVLFSVTAVLKAIGAFFDGCAAHLATDKTVADFISARPRMTADAMAKALASNTKIVWFDQNDSAAVFLMYAVIVMTVFIVFNELSLKTSLTKDK